MNKNSVTLHTVSFPFLFLAGVLVGISIMALRYSNRLDEVVKTANNHKMMLTEESESLIQMKGGVLDYMTSDVAKIEIRQKIDHLGYTAGEKDRSGDHILKGIISIEGISFLYVKGYSIDIIKASTFTWDEIIPQVDQILLEKLGSLEEQSSEKG